MHIAQLSLTNVRTFRRLELDLSRGFHVITGANATGKSNLLESITLLATTRATRAGPDAGIISWAALEDDPLPAARLAAHVESAAGQTTVEITVLTRELGGRSSPDRPPPTSRRFRVNGVAKRASDVIGRLRAVAFSASDIDLIDGPRANRRRYLDITISQFDPAYVRALQRYARVLQQRNGLLRRLHDRRGSPDELQFWDDELAASGAIVLAARAAALRALSRDAAAVYADLTAPGETLEVRYRPALPEELHDTLDALDESELASRLAAVLLDGRARDIQRGMTLVGPHRDDVAFLIDGHDAASTASRGEQRTAALALRLAEVTLSTDRSGEAPVLLLDDILSELDAARRERVLHVAYGVEQVFLTTPDEDRPTSEELPEARRYRLSEGALTAL